jgi:hypothetical protein
MFLPRQHDQPFSVTDELLEAKLGIPVDVNGHSVGM